jgi:hypothetical protein
LWHRSKHLVRADALAHIESKARSPNPQRAITPHYRVNGRGSSRASAGRDGRLPADERPIRTKNRRKMMGKPEFPGSNTSWRAEKAGACTPRSGTAICVESNRPLAMSNQFHAISTRRVRQTDRQNSPQRSGVASRTPLPIAEPSVCHQDPKLRKHAPKRAVRDIGRS